LATGSLLATGITPAQALDATPLYINFESNDPLKALATSVDGPFSGASTQIKAGTNLTTGDSLHFTKNGDPWSGVNILGATSTPYGYTSADKKVITFDYWSPDAGPSPVMLKLEAPAATYKAVEAQPGFNTITVDFTGVSSWTGDYTKLIIFPNFREAADSSYIGAPPVANTGQVYEIDNISINGGTAANVYVPQAIAFSTLVTFEANDTLGAGAVGEASGTKKQGSFAGTATTIENAPAGGNGGKALKIVKNGEVYAGVNVLAFDAATAMSNTTRVTNATHKTVTFNYYSPKADSPVRVELRGSPNALGKTVTAPLGWSKITVDFTDVAGWTSTEEFLNVILFPDFNVVAAGDVFYVDNLGINGATTPAIPVGRTATSTLLTFETGDTLGAAAAGPGFNGAVAVIKDAAAAGNGGKALEIEKAGDPWAGIVLATAPSNVKFLDATNKTVTMNYYSPQTVATPVQFQLEATDGSKINQAVEAAPGWSKLTIDFTASYNDAKQYTIARIYPNFVSAAEVPGYAGAPAVLPLTPVKFYFVDNVGFNGASTPAIPVPGVATSTLVTFEASDTLGAGAVGDASGAKKQGSFAGSVTTIEDAPAGGNGGKALKIVKNGLAYAGVNVLIFEPGTIRVTNGTYKTITFNYHSSKADSPVRIELRGYPNALGKTVTAPLGWSKITVDFTDVVGWTSTEEFLSVVLFPDFDVPAAGNIFYVDNLGINGASTPAIPVPSGATSTLVTFEASDTLGAGAVGDASGAKKQGSFAGSVTTIEDAPAGGNGGKALKIVKNGLAYAGVNVLIFEPGTIRVTNGTYKTITFNYHSSKADSPVRIELRGYPNALGKTVTAPLGWSKITVDFTDVVGWTSTEEFLSVVLFPDFDVPAAGNIFYVDNLGINGASTPAIPAPVTPREATNTLLTFETGDVLGAAAATPPTPQKPQGGFEGAATSIDVAPAGGNGGNALKITKNVGAQIYAGATLIKFGTDKRVTNGTHKVITFNFYSPKANVPVAVELRPYPNALSKTVIAPLGWSKMTFDFTDVAGWTSTEEFTLLSIFPDFNQPAGATATSYFVDNVAFNGAVTPEIPAVSVPREATSTLLTFETADTLGVKVVGDSTLAKPEGGFEGAVTTIDNAPAGGNGGKALKIVKGVGAPTYAGVNIIRFGADKRVTNGTYKTITFNYYSPKATSSVRVELRAFPNALGKTVTAPQGWSKITVDFTDVAGWTGTEEFVSVILFPDFDVAGAGGIFYVDNLAFNGATTPAIPLPKVKPTVKTAAAVGGTAKSARTLTAGKGSWTGTATITYTYKWYRCSVSSTKTATTAPTSSAKCAAISGGTKSTYKLASADVGKYVRVLITAKNSAGTAYSLSKTTSKVVK
jgi:hypothetical protein